MLIKARMCARSVQNANTADAGAPFKYVHFFRWESLWKFRPIHGEDTDTESARVRSGERVVFKTDMQCSRTF